MNRACFYMFFFLFHIISFKLFGAAHACADAMRYTKNPPIFYAALAEAAYEKSSMEAFMRVRKLVGSRTSVLSRKVYRSGAFGKTSFILAKDKSGDLHVAIEGSNDVGNWVANALFPIRGTVTRYDVPDNTRKAMHKLIKHWEKKHKKPIASISGHSQGGMYASQLVHWKNKHYRESGTQVITFNCYKPKKAKNQLHFLVTKEHAVSLVTSSGRYIKIDKTGKHTSLISNHGMKYFFRAFKDKSWDDVR